jgi:NAD(P)H-hydrate epimerase
MHTETYYTAAQVRELDRLASAEYDIPAFTLMQRAGAASFAALQQKWPEATSLEIFCGTGNNGGDGCIIGALALGAGLKPRLHIVGDPTRMRGDALKALQLASTRQVPMDQSAALEPGPGTIVVDALLGTGLSGDVRFPYDEAIDTINAGGLPVMAVDIPSGLDSDTGLIHGNCVTADLTVTFIARKQGLVRGKGPSRCGEVIFAALGVPEELYERLR